jgi:hypothetical protein
MSLDPPWAVLAPVDPARLEQRVLAALEFEEDERDRVKFEIVRGSGRYHAIIGTLEDEGVEDVIAEFLSHECAEPVYSIQGSQEPAEDASFPSLVDSYQRGVRKTLDVEPQELARFLDCPFPEPPPIELEPPLKTVALVEGVPVPKALRALEKLEKAEGFPPPQESYRLVETPRGLLIAPGVARLAGTHILLAERLPHQATVYGVTATPNLDMFFVSVYRRGKETEEFAQPPSKCPVPPTLSEIKGERSPERILAALGIPSEWFQQ